MNYEDRVVCFLDLLGFKKHVQSTINADGTVNQNRVNQTVNAIENIRYFFKPSPFLRESKRKVTHFSDSVVLSFPTDEESGVFEALLEILWVQLNLVGHKMLCRGGISIGKLVHNDEMLFGPALVDAYRLESKEALYPRVILDESVVKAGVTAHGNHHFARDELSSIMSLITRDSDEMFYIDYITKAGTELDDPTYDYPDYLNQLVEIIGNGLESNDPSVRAKYQWMKAKLSPHIKEIKISAKSDRFDPDIQAAYESIYDL